jgi:hypothetical protein
MEQYGQRRLVNLRGQLQALRTKGTRGIAVPRKSRNARHRKLQKTRRFSRH